MLRLKAELVSSGKCKYVSINTATHAALVAAVEKKFQIRCCRLLCEDGVHIEDDSDIAELREDDHILVYEKDAAGLAGVTDGDARLANRSEMISLLQVAPLEMHALGCAFQNYFRPKGPDTSGPIREYMCCKCSAKFERYSLCLAHIERKHPGAGSERHQIVCLPRPELVRNSTSSTLKGTMVLPMRRCSVEILGYIDEVDKRVASMVSLERDRATRELRGRSTRTGATSAVALIDYLRRVVGHMHTFFFSTSTADPKFTAVQALEECFLPSWDFFTNEPLAPFALSDLGRMISTTRTCLYENVISNTRDDLKMSDGIHHRLSEQPKVLERVQSAISKCAIRHDRSGNGSIVDELERLGTMHEEGMLTEEAFRAAKTRVLGCEEGNRTFLDQLERLGTMHEEGMLTKEALPDEVKACLLSELPKGRVIDREEEKQRLDGVRHHELRASPENTSDPAIV